MFKTLVQRMRATLNERDDFERMYCAFCALNSCASVLPSTYELFDQVSQVANLIRNPGSVRHREGRRISVETDRGGRRAARSLLPVG